MNGCPCHDSQVTPTNARHRSDQPVFREPPEVGLRGLVEEEDKWDPMWAEALFHSPCSLVS
jgi:Rieske Fe-S protein